MIRYYSLHRPVGPGIYPKPRGNKILQTYNYRNRRYVPSIDENAWGWIDYEKPLSDKDAANYELVWRHRDG